MSENGSGFNSRAIRQSILEKVQARGLDKSICPSEVARSLDPENWRSLMAQVRQVGAELLAEGEILVLQQGNPVHPLTARGPIRFKLAKMRSPECGIDASIARMHEENNTSM